MAGIALCGGRHMVRRFRQRVDRNIRTTMTGGTVARRQWASRARVAHNRRFERRVVLVTGVALRRRWDMRRGFEHFRCTACNVARRARTGGSCWMSKRGSGPHSG